MVGRIRKSSIGWALVMGFAQAILLGGCTLQTSITDLDSGNLFPRLILTDVSVTEGNVGTYTISLSKPASASVVVMYSTAPASATAAMDFTSQVGTATIAPGQRFTTINLTTLDDPNFEGPENFTLQISAATNASMAAAVISSSVTIVDDEPTPDITIGDATVTEGGTLVFTVSLSVPSELPVAFDYATVSGTAAGGTDFTAISGRFTFPALSVTTTLEVESIQDLLNEADETLSLTLSGLQNAIAVDIDGLGAITNDDPEPSLSISDLVILEGESASLAANLSSLSGQDIVFNLATTNGTALAPGDYAAVNMIAITIPALSPSHTVTLVTVEDLIDEVNESFAVTLTGVTNATGGTWLANVTITDDDDPPAIFVTDATGNEGGTLAFVVSLSIESGLPITFDYATYDGSATTPDVDYSAATGGNTFAPGVFALTIPVVTTDDSKYELTETLTLSLAAVVNASVGDAAGLGTITNDDLPPVLMVADMSFNEGETGVFVATLAAVSGVNVVFSWATANGSDVNPLNNAATPGDYTEVSDTWVTIAAGSTFVNLPVVSVQDALFENDEEVRVIVSGVTGASPVAIVATGTIIDDEATPEIFISDLSVGEGATGEFTVTLSGASGFDVVFNWATADNTALQSADYAQVSLTTVTIPAGSLSAALTVVTAQDLINEGAEIFHVNLSGVTNANVGDSQGEASIVDDDGPPQILIGDVTETEGGTLSFLVTLTAASGLDVSFDLATADGVATSAEFDYTAIATTRITIPAGSISYTQPVVSLQDALDEYDETLFVNLSGPTNGVILDG